MELKVNAVVLRAADYGENDKILTLLSAERGRISAGIKGVKKAGAKLRFAAQPFCFAEYVLSARGERYTVTGCTECESFYEIRTDINKFYAASAAAECALALSFEGDGSRELFSLVIDALSGICAGNEGEALARFLVESLRVSGYGLSAGDCPRCGKSLSDGKTPLRFDMDSGEFLCASCGEGAGASFSTYNVIKKSLSLSYDGEFVTPDGVKRALRLLREYFAYKTDARLAALSEYIRLL